MQWADYQHFALHQLPDNATEIEIVEGLSLPCPGYISGTWTDFNVCQQRKVHEVFVVDAGFLSAGVHGGMPRFALRQETLQSSKYHEGKSLPIFEHKYGDGRGRKSPTLKNAPSAHG